MSLTPERVEDIRASDYAHEIPPVMALCEDWIALRKRAEDAELALADREHRSCKRDQELIDLKAKLAGMKQEWRVTFLYVDGTADESLNHSSKEEALETLTVYRESLPNSCTDFRVQTRYMATDWKDVEPA